jgi:hypothetical protein
MFMNKLVLIFAIDVPGFLGQAYIGNVTALAAWWFVAGYCIPWEIGPPENRCLLSMRHLSCGAGGGGFVVCGSVNVCLVVTH